MPSLVLDPDVHEESVEIALGLPPLQERQKLNAQEPLILVMRYDVGIRVLLSRLAGTRMCMRCPECNTFENEEDDRLGCSNKFGNNAMPFGGSD